MSITSVILVLYNAPQYKLMNPKFAKNICIGHGKLLSDRNAQKHVSNIMSC